MKGWRTAAFLALFPITGWVGSHYAYLENNRRFYRYYATIILALFVVDLGLTARERITNMGLLITVWNWYNAYGYIRFGIIKAENTDSFLKDTWITDWSKDERAKLEVEEEKRRAKLEVEEEKRRVKKSAEEAEAAAKKNEEEKAKKVEYKTKQLEKAIKLKEEGGIENLEKALKILKNYE